MDVMESGRSSHEVGRRGKNPLTLTVAFPNLVQHLRQPVIGRVEQSQAHRGVSLETAVCQSQATERSQITKAPNRSVPKASGVAGQHSQLTVATDQPLVTAAYTGATQPANSHSNRSVGQPYISSITTSAHSQQAASIVSNTSVPASIASRAQSQALHHQSQQQLSQSHFSTSQLLPATVTTNNSRPASMMATQAANPATGGSDASATAAVKVVPLSSEMSQPVPLVDLIKHDFIQPGADRLSCIVMVSCIHRGSQNSKNLVAIFENIAVTKAH